MKETWGKCFHGFGYGKIFLKEKTRFTKYKGMIIKLDYTNIKNFCFLRNSIKRLW